MDIDLLNRCNEKIDIEENIYILSDDEKQIKSNILRENENCIRLLHEENMEPNNELIDIVCQYLENADSQENINEEVSKIIEYEEIEEKYRVTNVKIK